MPLSNKLKNSIADVLQVEPEDKEDLFEALDNAEEDAWSSMSLPERSGPPLWETLHWMGAVADKEHNRNLYVRTLNLLMDGHPCKEICRKGMKEDLRVINYRMYDSMLDHSIDLRNYVNRRMKKPEIPYEYMIQRYDLECDSCIFSPSMKSHVSNASTTTPSVRPIGGSTTRNQDSSRYDGARDTHQPSIHSYGRSYASHSIS